MGQNHYRWQCREDVQRHRVEGEKCRKQRDGSHDVTVTKQLLKPSPVRLFPFRRLTAGLVHRTRALDQTSPDRHAEHSVHLPDSSAGECTSPLVQSLCVQSNCPGVCPPLQEAVAQGLLHNLELMGRPECYFSSLSEELEGKRDRLAAILRDVGMTPIIPEGGYFMLVDVTPLSERQTDHFHSTSLSVFPLQVLLPKGQN